MIVICSIKQKLREKFAIGFAVENTEIEMKELDVEWVVPASQVDFCFVAQFPLATIIGENVTLCC